MIKNQIVKCLFLILVAVLINGCVTKEYVYEDSKLSERTIDTESAAMARLKLALEYLKQGHMVAAKLNLDRAARANDRIDGIQSSYAFYYEKVGEIVKADLAYKKAVAQFPGNANIRNNYGAFLCNQKNYQAANEQFILAINTDSNSQMANTHENAALCAIRAKDWSIAKTHLVRVLKYTPYHARSIINLAKTNAMLGDYDGAQTQLKAYRKLYANSPQSLWVNILIEHGQKNNAMVETFGQLLLNKFPDSKAAKKFIAKNFND